jgi:hypothetical protein
MHDGVVEVIADGAVHYVVVASGTPVRGYFTDARTGEVTARLRLLLEDGTYAAPPLVRLWARPEALPAQASPALIQAYRDLMAALVDRLRAAGVAAAADILEGARRSLVQRHPLLDRFSPSHPTIKDPVTDTPALSAAVGAWITDVMWAAAPDDHPAEEIIREVTEARRHMFQAAGLYDALPWKVAW